MRHSLAFLGQKMAAFCLLILLANSASAQIPPPMDLLPSEQVIRNVFFASLDASERQRFGGWGFKRALGGTLSAPGWRMLTTTGVKIREIDLTSGERINRIDGGRVLFGREWHEAGISITALAGLSITRNSAEIAQATRRVSRLGPVGQIELWKTWSSDPPLAGLPWESKFSSLTVIADHANRSVYARTRHGFVLPISTLSKTMAQVSIGPEMSISLGAKQSKHGIVIQEAWRHARFGLHLGEIPVWRFRLVMAAGIEMRRNGHIGSYTQLTSHIHY